MKRLIYLVVLLFVASASQAISITGDSVDPLAQYRRPNLVWISTGDVELEGGNVDGTTNKTCVIWPDRSQRCVTETTSSATHASRRFAFAQKASWGSVLNAGMSPYETLSTSSTVAFYVVRSTSDSTNFTLVGSTWAPVTANYATLNGFFGTGGWVYVGLGMYGDNNSGPSNANGFCKFIQSGMVTFLRNATTLNSVSWVGYKLAFSASSASLTYTYASGMGQAQVAPNIFIAYVQGSSNNVATNEEMNLFSAGQTIAYAISPRGGITATRTALLALVPIADGLNLATASTAVHLEITMTGWVDSALGGPNPLF